MADRHLQPMIFLLIAGLFLRPAIADPQELPMPGASPPTFSDAERAAVVAYWNAPGRYRIEPPPEAAWSGAWCVRLTPEASRWFFAYQKAVGAAKAPPTQDVPPVTSEEIAAWEAWVQARLEHDRWRAGRTAAAGNGVLGSTPELFAASDPPPLPGPIPPGLLAAAGNPPPLAAAVAPLQYVVTFDTGEVCVYTDQVEVRPRFAYFRFAQGVMHAGTPLKRLSDAELDPLFAGAGMSAAEVRVAKAVSRLEGGFESVNTYDTGYLSVGFIQFAALENGAGSLGTVLLREKRDSPVAFEQDFRRFGVDVNERGVLVVLDPDTGAELLGPAAVRETIEDKRLTAVFQRAGSVSGAFRTSQVGVARSVYWPADDPVTVTVNGQTVSGKVSDVIKSEAGMATLFDRKVNRGRIEPFADVLTQVMTAHNLTALPDVAPFEREIVTALKYREDFLANATLSQPR